MTHLKAMTFAREHFQLTGSQGKQKYISILMSLQISRNPLIIFNQNPFSGVPGVTLGNTGSEDNRVCYYSLRKRQILTK